MDEATSASHDQAAGEQILNVVKCPLCAVSVVVEHLDPGDAARCGRCDEVVARELDETVFQSVWALATAGLMLLALANVYPIMTFDVVGNTQSNLIVTGIQALLAQQYWPIAGLVAFCAIIAPALHLGAVWYSSGACSISRPWPGAIAAARIAGFLEGWSLVPVFAVACMVAVVKLDMLGTVTWDQGITWIALLAGCTLLISSRFHPEEVEEYLSSLE